ncbi:DUF6233 domain-containing protein [Streptomyces mutabilis]|uniref:DUF6233 domain-containing protein n=1 Tax=Streptomyces mutabilis TaxID=67332 RepID=UPI003A4C5AAD
MYIESTARAVAMRSSAWSSAPHAEHQVRRTGPGPGVLHAPDCAEAPEGAPLLDVQRALDVAENPRTRLCTLCGCAQELTPLLSGFDYITDS